MKRLSPFEEVEIVKLIKANSDLVDENGKRLPKDEDGAYIEPLPVPYFVRYRRMTGQNRRWNGSLIASAMGGGVDTSHVTRVRAGYVGPLYKLPKPAKAAAKRSAAARDLADIERAVVDGMLRMDALEERVQRLESDRVDARVAHLYATQENRV